MTDLSQCNPVRKMTSCRIAVTKCPVEYAIRCHSELYTIHANLHKGTVKGQIAMYNLLLNVKSSKLAIF